MSDQVGRVISGRYRLLQPIGAGASAEVYLADDVRLRRRVAVKVLHAALAHDDQFLRRFRAEAQAAAALSHPNVVAVYDWGEDDLPYIVTEYLGGGSLRSILDAGHRLTASQALLVGLEATRGLDYAHRRGFVHRDIKPANIMFGEDRRLRIADFGLARALAEAAWTEPSGAVLGTARYASPEQAKGMPVDGRSDMYSLGLVLIEAVTGRVPFASDTTIGTLMARVDTPVPVPDEMGPLAKPLRRIGDPDPEQRPTSGDFGVSLMAAAELLDRPEPIPLAPPQTGTFVADDPGDATALHNAVPTVAAPVVPPTTTVELPEPEERRKRRWPVVTLITLIALIAGAAGAYALVNAQVPTHTVPRLEGRTEQQARSAVAELGWKIDVRFQRKDNTTAGEFITTIPPPGESLKEGKTLVLVVSRGNPLVDLPTKLEGKTRAEAEAAVRAAGLVPVFTEVFDEKIAKDIVMTAPKVEQLPKGSEVAMKVSAGPKPRIVPDGLEGGTFEQAKKALEAVQLKAKKVEVFSDDVKKGRVVGTAPAGGAEVARGGTVEVQVSKGPDLVVVPTVDGKTLQEAIAALHAAGLVDGNVFGPASGQPFATDPEEGTKVHRGSTVDIYLKK